MKIITHHNDGGNVTRKLSIQVPLAMKIKPAKYLKTALKAIVFIFSCLNPLIIMHVISLWIKSEKKIPNKNTFRKLTPQKKYYTGLAALLLFGALLTAGVELYLVNTRTVPARGGEYREAIIGAPRFINPILAPTNDADRDISRLVYASLMKYDESGELVPDMAESFEILRGGRQYRFKLKDNLVWEDGQTISAEDVVFTIKLIQDQQYSSPLNANWQGVGVASEGPQTVIFDLSSSYAPFLENATVGILPRHIWQGINPASFSLTDFNLQPVGSGLFLVEKFTKDNSGFITSYTLKRNEKYHGQKSFLNHIIFRFFPSEESAIAALNANGVDGISSLSASNVANINADNINLHEFRMPRYFAIFFNAEHNEILQDKRVRQALAHATDIQKINTTILNDFAQISDTPIPPALNKYYNTDTGSLGFDAQRAQEILNDANWIDSDSNGIREKVLRTSDGPRALEFNLVTVRWPELEQVAIEIAEQWHALGIQLNVELQELGELQQNFIRPRNYEMLLLGEVLGAIPDPFSFWHSSQKNDPGLNLSKYSNKVADRLLEEARQEFDTAAQINKYKELQKLIVSDLPALFLYEPTYIYPVRKGVQNITPSLIVDPSYRFNSAENWFVETKRVF